LGSFLTLDDSGVVFGTCFSHPGVRAIFALGSILLWHSVSPLAAQVFDGPTPPAPPALHPLVTIGSAWEDRLRLEQLLGQSAADGFLLRSASSLTPTLQVGPSDVPLEVLIPEFRYVSNSAIPYSLNDGLMWAGRGGSFKASFGARAAYGPVSLTLAPEATYSRNRAFEILPWPLYLGRPGRNQFGSLWYSEGGDIDLPYRFGEDAFTKASPGQSSLVVAAGPADLGVATENQWWGPGLRNALVMSNNAPGFAHLFARTASPLRTRVGSFEARWLVGGLRESAYYDTVRDNNLRSISGAVITYSPALDPWLTLGLARTVVGPAAGTGDALSHALRVFRSWERRDSAAQLDWEPDSDQIISLFGRWVLPEDGAEVYFEWARHELPVSIRDLLLTPHHTQGYTIGLQWARPAAPGIVRLQGEITQLEQSATFKQRPFDPFYTGRAAPQGYTHRGQILGAAIGPGSSSQWLAVDLLRDRTRLGLFGGRVRWENDAFYASPSPDPARGHRTPHAHDVSVLGGVRGGYVVAGLELSAELTLARRYNYLFQNPDRGFGPEGAVDVWNRTFRIQITPARLSPLVGS
jgi:hypothetical protein